MPEGRVAAFCGALLDTAVRRVRLVTILMLVGVTSLIVLHDASWTSVVVAGITVLAVAGGWLGASRRLRMIQTSGGRRKS